MTRSANFVKGLGSSYLLLALNAIYTFVSVPVALHFLSIAEFGIWVVVGRISGYLLLLDLGTSGSGIRLLMDHKDRPGDSSYGGLIKTAMLIQGVQAPLILLVGVTLLPMLGPLLNLPAVLRHDFNVLWLWQVGLLSLSFLGRITVQLLTAHHRMDQVNYSQCLSLLANFAALVISFNYGLGLYSFAVGQTCATVVSLLWTLGATVRLRLFPERGTWGRVNARAAKNLISFGRDMFFLSTGLLLLNSSQVAIITRVLGPEVVTIWDVATKIFTLAQQFIARVWDSSMTAIAEMIVRGERERMWTRFQDILVLTGSVGVWAAAAAAVGNGPLLAVWTHGRIAWSGWNDALMAVLVVLNSITRLHIGLAGQTKQLRGLQFIYFLEGASFVLLAIWAGGRFGLTGILGSAILMNLLWSGLHGIRRTAAEVGERPGVVLWRCQIAPLRSGVAMAGLAGVTAWLTRGLEPWPQLTVVTLVMFFGGLAIFWWMGLTDRLRREPFAFLARLRKR